MRLPTPEQIAVVFDPETWRDNPFFLREARRDANRRQPFKSLVWMSGTLFVVGLLALVALYFIRLSGNRFLWYLGDEIGALLCIALCGAHVLFIVGAAQKHTAQMLNQEVYRNTFSALLLLPQSPFQTVVQAAAYPWKAAMRMAVVCLPLYALCVRLQGVTWRDIGMLYLVYALLALQFPIWRKPARDDNAMQIPSPLAGMGAAARANSATPNASSSAPSSGFQNIGWLYFSLFQFMRLIGQNGNLRGMRTALHPYVPDTILVLLPSALLSWPLLFARALLTSFAWFGWPVVPLPFFLALILAYRYAGIVRTTEFLSVGAYRDLVLQPTYRARRHLEGALRLLLAFVLTGYLWGWAVTNGGARPLVTSNGPAGAPGLIGFGYLLLFVGWWRVIMRAAALGLWMRRSAPGPKITVIRRLHRRTVVRYLLEPLASLLVFYLLACLLSGTPPLSPPLLTLAGRMATVGSGGALLAFGARLLWGEGANFWGLLLLPTAWGVGPQMPHLGAFSPTLGLIALADHNLFGPIGAYLPALPWTQWAITSGATGLFLCLPYLAVRRRYAAATSPGVSESDTAAAREIDPTTVGAEVFQDDAQAKQQQDKVTDSPFGQRLVAAVQRVWDNAVLTKEMRVRWRNLAARRLAAGVIFLCLATVILVAAFEQQPALPQKISQVFFGRIPTLPAQALATTLALSLLFLPLFGFIIGFSGTSAFVPEKTKSTLGFLLITPLRSSAVVLGKAGGIVAVFAPTLTIALVYTLSLCLLLLPSAGLAPLLLWGRAVLTMLCLMAAFGMVTLALSTYVSPKNPARVVLLALLLFYLCIGLFALLMITQGQHLFGRVRLRGSGPLAVANGTTVWLATLGLCLFIAALAALFAIWRIHRMRRGNVTFEGSARDN